MLSKEREQQLIAFTQKMIRQRSYSGEEDKVAAVMKEFSDANGFTDVHVDKYGNCICHIKG